MHICIIYLPTVIDQFPACGRMKRKVVKGMTFSAMRALLEAAWLRVSAAIDAPATYYRAPRIQRSLDHRVRALRWL